MQINLRQHVCCTPWPELEDPKDFSALQRLLQERLDQLPDGRQRIARLVLGDPEGCAFRTISETARLTGVHESSVGRFATSLGLSGYPALTALCRQKLRDRSQLVDRFDSAARLGGKATPDHHQGGLLGEVAARDQANLAGTLAAIEPATWDRAVGWLAAGRRIHVIGQRKCFAVAYLMSYLLRLVREEVHQLGAAPGLLVEELRDLAPGDVLVAISIHRYSRDTLTAARRAAQRGARVIALTDYPSSPLARHAGACFYVDTGAVTILRSVVGFVSLVQALATQVAVERGARSRSALKKDEELLAALGVYASDDGPAPVLGSRARARPRAHPRRR